MSYFWFIIGTIVGSFLNVCIHRLPRGESIVFPSSHCVNCGAKLSPLDLIPVLGYLFLKGKCRYCQAKISFRYPLVEFLTGIAFAFIWKVNGGEIYNSIFQIIFASMLIVVFFTDLERQVIPDAASFLGILLGLIYNLLNKNIPSALFGMFLGYGLFYVIGWLGRILFKKEAMGEGDLILAAALGAFLGWEGMLLSLFFAYLLAAVVAIALLALGKVKMGQQIPFGPALAAGGGIALFFGPQILRWYKVVFF